MNDKYVIPPIIANWISCLQDANSPLHIRENYARMLTNVQDACTIELGKFRMVKDNPKLKRKSNA